jgi:hypothetical protein
LGSVTTRQIKKGIVLHLDPSTLEAEGATYSCASEMRVQGGHFFVCISTNGQKARLVPVYSDNGPGRVEILPTDRSGHDKWTSGPAYYHPEQVWNATNEAVVKAAAAGGDRSTEISRNLLTVAALPKPGPSLPPK